MGGGYWPKGTADQYIFASGFQIAGIVGDASDNPWAGDTSSAAFFNPVGGEATASRCVPSSTLTDPGDLANWPAAAYVPPVMPPRISSTRFSGAGNRPHRATSGGSPGTGTRCSPAAPLGSIHSVCCWSSGGWAGTFRAGNEDILYFIYTIYNITSTDAADYSNVRPAMRGDSAGEGQRIPSAEQCGVRRDAPGSEAIPSMNVRGVRRRHGCSSLRCRTTPRSTFRSPWGTPTTTASASPRTGPSTRKSSALRSLPEPALPE